MVTVLGLKVSADVKVCEADVVLVLDFTFVVSSLVAAAVGFVKGNVLEVTVEDVWTAIVVSEFGLTADVDVRVGASSLVVFVVSLEVVVGEVETTVGGCVIVDRVVRGVIVLTDVESGWLVVKSVVIVGLVDVTWVVIVP